MKVEEILCYMQMINYINRYFSLLYSHFITMRFRHKNSHTYGAKPWEFWVATHRVTGAKYGNGNCWLGIYTLYYMYVGDMNTLYKSILRNPTRGRDVPRRVSTSGHVLSGWGCCGCIYILCRGYKYIV